jgi:hypothetical protein
MSAAKKRTILGCAAALALAAGAALFWWHGRVPVAKADVAAFLDRTQGGDRLRFTVEAVAPLREANGEIQLGVAATGHATGPLFTKLDAADYLARSLQVDTAEAAKASELMQQEAPAPSSPVPEDPLKAVILQPSAPAGAPFPFQGVIAARKNGGAWDFRLLSGGFEGAGPQGDLRSLFGAAAYAAGDPGDDARLRALVSAFRDFTARVILERKALDLGGPTHREVLMAHIAPGTVFRGQATEVGEQVGTTLYLEIADVTAEGDVTALLRNEGGWRSARTFQGSWGTDDASGAPVLNLSSSPDQAVSGAGPFLENTQMWTFALKVDAQGRLTEDNRLYRYRFLPLSLDQTGAARIRLEAEASRALAATESGVLYHGTAVFRATGASEAILLRFGEQAEDGSSIGAAIESTTRPWKRALHGSILQNSRRSGGEPIRLETQASEAVADAPADSVLGDRDDLDLHLGLDGASLVGGDALFTYQLAPAGEADLQRLEAARAERRRLFLNAFRTDIEFDGELHEEQGYIGHARLEIAHIEPGTGAIRARIDSLAWPGVHRDFVGTCDPSSGSVVLVATAKGSFDESGEFDVPFLVSPSPATLHLILDGSVITGIIEGDARWRMEFPASVFLATPTENVDAGIPPGIGAVFPALPKADGAYLLAHGVWEALPRNNGRIVVEEVKESSGVLEATNVADALQREIAHVAAKTVKKKISYLEFDGKEPLPISTGQTLVLCVVGKERGGIPVQLTASELQKEGQRRVMIGNGAQTKVLFSERVPTYVRLVAPGHLMITATAVLAPGLYATNADGGYEFRQE